jgi:multidrug efflux system membrane fusion protein
MISKTVGLNPLTPIPVEPGTVPDHTPEQGIGTGQRARAPQKPRGSWLAKLLVLAILGGATYVGIEWGLPLIKLGGGVPPRPPKPPVSVVTAIAQKQDMDLYLNGLGTVTAFFTVTLRSRVDGELIKVDFIEGQMIKQGQLLAEIDPRPFQVQLQQAEGQLTKDQAALKVANLDLDRYTALATSRSVTQQQLDEQKALVKQSEGAVQTDQATIDNAKLQLTYARITSPIDGRIGLRLVDPGNMVHANDVTGLAVITQLQPIALVFTIPQDDISRVQRKFGKDDKLVVEAYDRDFINQLAVGSLMAIDNQVDATTGTVRLKAVFQNEDNLLFPNQFVNARLLIDTLHDALVVPSAAVQRGPQSTFIYVVKSDSTIDLRDVEVGQTEGDRTAIVSGVQPGEVVVIEGVDKLLKGTKVAPREHKAPPKTLESAKSPAKGSKEAG